MFCTAQRLPEQTYIGSVGSQHIMLQFFQLRRIQWSRGPLPNEESEWRTLVNITNNHPTEGQRDIKNTKRFWMFIEVFLEILRFMRWCPWCFFRHFSLKDPSDRAKRIGPREARARFPLHVYRLQETRNRHRLDTRPRRRARWCWNALLWCPGRFVQPCFGAMWTKHVELVEQFWYLFNLDPTSSTYRTLGRMKPIT